MQCAKVRTEGGRQWKPREDNNKRKMLAVQGREERRGQQGEMRQRRTARGTRQSMFKRQIKTLLLPGI